MSNHKKSKYSIFVLFFTLIFFVAQSICEAEGLVKSSLPGVEAKQEVSLPEELSNVKKIKSLGVKTPESAYQNPSDHINGEAPVSVDSNASSLEQRSAVVTAKGDQELSQEEKRAQEEKRLAQEEILIEARILQIVLNQEHQEGIDWSAIVSDFNLLDFRKRLRNWGYDGEDQKLGAGTISNDDYAVLLEALETVGMVNVLSKTYFLTAHQKESVVAVSPQNFIQPEGSTPFDYEGKDIGFSLGIRPELKVEEPMIVSLHPEYRYLTDALLQGEERWKVIEQFGQEYSITTQEQHTIIIGGLYRNEQIDYIRKVPLLGDLPFVGFAFRNHSRRPQKTEIIIFLTPRINDQEKKGKDG